MRQLTKRVVAANVVVAAVLLLLVSLQLTVDRAEVLGTARDRANDIAMSLAGDVERNLALIDIGLVAIGEALHREPDMDVQALHHLLARRQRQTLGLNAFLVMDARGHTVAVSGLPVGAPVGDGVDPAYLQARHAGIDGPLIGLPRRDLPGLGGDWGVSISRILRDADGRFNGVVAAVLPLQSLVNGFEDLRIGAGGAVVIFSDAGTMLARAPLVSGYIGQSYADVPGFLEQLRASGDGDVFAYPADGVRRLSVARPIAQGQAHVLAGLALAEVLEPWWRRAVFQAAIALLGLLMFIGASYFFLREVSQQQRWEGQRSARLRLLARSSAALARCRDAHSLLRQLTETARELIGAHQAASSLNRAGARAPQVHAVSLSDKYARWQDYDETPDGSGIYRRVCEFNEPMLLSQAELEAHPDWRGFGEASERHPPMRGWLAVPIVSQDGHNLGLIQLSDKYNGEFSVDDLNELSQLASFAGVALDNLDGRGALERALVQVTESRDEIETVFTSISDAVIAMDRDWRFIYLNAEAERLLRRGRDELLGRIAWEEFPEARDTEMYSAYHRARDEGVPVGLELYYAPLEAWLNIRAFPARNGVTVYFQDVSVRRETEARLRQSQKMEAVGQLTGGVAHDFNNLLTVILGTGEQLQQTLDKAQVSPAEREQLRTMLQAAGRAAALTHRLLAFARKQPLNPSPVDVNELVGDAESILRRTLGEHIDIELVRGTGLWRASVDANELQNAILNLAINARDAMPGSGKLTIETANASVDADYAEAHEMTPGQYVMIAVSDTGHGMPPEVLERVFDPFYTTKAAGKGSGLGLSMVYGFVRQSNGMVKIYSEVGEGSTVRLYLPRAEGGGNMSERRRQLFDGVPRGSERILLLEDDALVRRYVITSLESLGYAVTACEAGQEALDRLEEQPFDLLLTDVVLPGGLSGKDVAREVARRRPEMRILFMSGYTENAIVHHGRLDPGVNLLGKPFRLADLARKVRSVLDAPAPDAPA